MTMDKIDFLCFNKISLQKISKSVDMRSWNLESIFFYNNTLNTIQVQQKLKQSNKKICIVMSHPYESHSY